MDDNERIEQIKKRLAANEYFINPHSDVNVRGDVEYLLHSSEKRTSASPSLKKKSALLSQQVQELVIEIENVKGDFGNLR